MNGTTQRAMKHINENELDEDGEFDCPVCGRTCQWGDSACPSCGENFSHHHVGGLEDALEFVQHRSLARTVGELDVAVCPIHGPRAIMRQFSPPDESEKWCPQCGLELEIVEESEADAPGEVLSMIGDISSELERLGYSGVSEEADSLYQMFGTTLLEEKVDDDD